ncbi:MAG: IgGFc-binding protein, partial [Ignavibacteriota bacterium]
MKKSVLIQKPFRKSFVLFLLIVAVLASEKSSAQHQGIPSEGRDFYFGYVYTSFNKNPNNASGVNVSGFYNVYALVSSFEDNNQVKISYFDPGSGKEIQSIVKFVTAHNAIEVALDQVAMRPTDPGEKPEFRACHITSKKPVNVQFFSTGANSGGSYLSLPTNALGKNYVVSSYYDNPKLGSVSPQRAENAGGFFEIIATENNTNVTITPNGLTSGGKIGTNTGAGSTGARHPFTVTLMRGQVYLVKGDGSNEYNDMSGSIITSDKPIAVLSGHEDAFIGGVNGYTTDARNFMIQQLVPAEDFESDGYVTVPFVEAPGSHDYDEGYGENFRVYAFDTNTVSIQASSPTGTADIPSSAYHNPGQEIRNIATPMEFHSADQRKFSVMMYDIRNQHLEAPAPAPCMMMIVPMSHWRTSFVFYVSANSFVQWQNYYIHLIGLRSDIDKQFIEYTFNGGALKKLSSLTKVATYNNIPKHTELEGVRYSVTPGAYYFTNTRDAYLHPFTDTGYYATTEDQRIADTSLLRGAFMIYLNQFRGLDPDRDIGDFDGDDFFFEMATPVG